MKRSAIALLLFSISASAVAKTHKEPYTIPCSTLWPAVKDVLRNSGKYGIISITNDEMTAAYNIGGNLTAKRTNTVLLNVAGTGCEMQIQTAYSGLINNDAADFKKRVDESLEKLKSAAPAPEPAPAK